MALIASDDSRYNLFDITKSDMVVAAFDNSKAEDGREHVTRGESKEFYGLL